MDRTGHRKMPWMTLTHSLRLNGVRGSHAIGSKIDRCARRHPGSLIVAAGPEFGIQKAGGDGIRCTSCTTVARDTGKGKVIPGGSGTVFWIFVLRLIVGVEPSRRVTPPIPDIARGKEIGMGGGDYASIPAGRAIRPIPDIIIKWLIW